MKGLATLLVTLLHSILLLPSTSLYAINHKRQLPPAFSNFSFPPQICTYYGISAIPSCFESLFSSSSTSFSTFTASTRSKREYSDLSTSSICGSLCYHLLAILGNLLHDHATLNELVEANKLQDLLEMLAINSQIQDSLFQLIVHKQLIRTLCTLTSANSADLNQILVLKDQVHHTSC